MKERKSSFSRSFDYTVTLASSIENGHTERKQETRSRLLWWSRVLRKHYKRRKRRRRAWSIPCVQNRTKEISRSELQRLLESPHLPILSSSSFFRLLFFAFLLTGTATRIYSAVAPLTSKYRKKGYVNLHKQFQKEMCSWFVELNLLNFMNI